MKSMRGRKIWLICGAAAIVISALWGCAYSTQSRLPEHIRTISVGMFTNDTEYLRVESKLTNAIITAINQTPGYQVASGNADAELSGEILEIRNTVLSYDAKNEPRESQIAVVVKFTLYDNKNNEFALMSGKITSSQNGTLAGRYYPDSGSGFDNAIDAAVSEAAKVLVRNLMTSTDFNARKERRAATSEN